MANATVITITDSIVKMSVGDTEPPDWDAATGVETFSCQVATAAINATPNLADVPATFCQPATQVPAASSYEVAITALQDWTDVAGLSMFLFDNETKLGWVQLSIPTNDVGDAIAVATAQVRFVAGSFGGEAGTPLQFDVVLPVQGRPAIAQATVPTP